MQLCFAMLCALAVFVGGIERTEVFEVCVTISVLLHYFTLVSVAWIGAEALLMFRKLIKRVTVKFIVIVSLCCWRKSHIVRLQRTYHIIP